MCAVAQRASRISIYEKRKRIPMQSIGDLLLLANGNEF